MYKLGLHAVTKTWQNQCALKNISLTIEPNSKVALVGSNGCGKTTTIRLIGALLQASSGQVHINDRPVDQMSRIEIRRYRQHCGFIEQSTHIIPQLSVYDNVLIGKLALLPWYHAAGHALWRTKDADVIHALNEVGLTNSIWKASDSLSGGQKQRVAIARNIIRKPKVILADEPMSNLDPQTTEQIISILDKQTKKYRATLIITTHHIQRIIKYIDRVIGLKQGSIAFDKPASLITKSDLDTLYANEHSA